MVLEFRRGEYGHLTSRPSPRCGRDWAGEGCCTSGTETRAFTQAGGDYYLCPLSEVQLPPEVLEEYLAPVESGEQPLTDVYREKGEGEWERIAEGYERLEVLTAEVEGQTVIWTERRLVLRSLKQAQAAEAALRARLAKAQCALAALNEKGRGKKRFRDVESLRQAAEALVAQHRVQGLLRLGYEEEVREQPVRGYGGRPASVRQERELAAQWPLGPLCPGLCRGGSANWVGYCGLYLNMACPTTMITNRRPSAAAVKSPFPLSSERSNGEKGQGERGKNFGMRHIGYLPIRWLLL